MQTIKEKIIHLNQLIIERKALYVFEIYYDDEVVMQENENPPTARKETNCQRNVEFFSSIPEFREAKPLEVVFGENFFT